MSEFKEICWNIINCLIAAALVFIGAISNGEINWNTFIFALLAAGIVFFTQFKSYWDSERQEWCSTKVFQFV